MMSSEESAAPPPAGLRTWELWLAFIFGLAMLVVPDIFGFFQSAARGTPISAVEIVGTSLDATFFLIVVYLLRRDLLRRRVAAAALKRSNADLQRADRFKTELLGIAAHDLKNPLASIRALARLLAETPEASKSVVETAHHMESVAEEMLGLVHELLETAALEGAKLTLNLSLVDLSEVVSAAVTDWQPTAQRKKQRIEIRASDSAVVKADVGRFRQVLGNLLGNALKFSPPGTTVTVDTEVAGSAAVVVISDEGPGLTEADIARAFHRFQRLSARPTGGESSTGLGLWIVKEIVALHQGRVWITSEGPGKGAQVHVALPLAEPIHPQKSEPRGHPIAARF